MDAGAMKRESGSGSRVVVVSGSTGLIGRRLAGALEAKEYAVRPLVRRAASDPREITWDPVRGTIDRAALESADAVLNLAGENIGQRWTAERKRRIRESRTKGTALLATTIASLARPPRVFLNASAMG